MTKFIITTPEELQSVVSQSVKNAFAENIPLQSKQPKTILRTKKEAKDLFQASMVTIDRWCKKGLLKRIEVGGRVFITDESIQDLLKK